MLRLLRDGDTLVITRLDRLGRSLLHLVTLGAQLRDRGIGLQVIEQGIDTSTAEGRAMFGMLSVLAELQRELIAANTRDGLAAARARGRVGGRKPKLTAEQATLAQQLYDARDKTVAQIAALFGVPRSTVYGHLVVSAPTTAVRGAAVASPRQPNKQGDLVARGRCADADHSATRAEARGPRHVGQAARSSGHRPLRGAGQVAPADGDAVTVLGPPGS